jgi:ABC-type nitrate/sulfonate/bicarbonate transport system substrate-binding protein
MATSAAPSTRFAAEQGMPLKVIASIAREKQGSFNTTYLALDDSGIRSAADVRGKTIGIVDFKSATELWARAAVEAAGLNPDRDVNFVVVPFPGMGEALRAKRIDVGVFPEPFVTIEKGRGGVTQVWTAKTGVPFEEELLDLVVRPEFLNQNRAAVQAFLADFVAATRYYLDHTEEAKLALIDKGYVQTPPDVYVKLVDSYREPTGRVTIEGLQQEQDLHLKLGWQRQKLDIPTLVDATVLPQ